MKTQVNTTSGLDAIRGANISAVFSYAYFYFYFGAKTPIHI